MNDRLEPYAAGIAAQAEAENLAFQLPLPAELLPPRAERRRELRSERKAAKVKAPGTAMVTAEEVTLILSGETRDKFRGHVDAGWEMTPRVQRSEVANVVFRAGLKLLDMLAEEQRKAAQAEAEKSNLVQLAGTIPVPRKVGMGALLAGR